MKKSLLLFFLISCSYFSFSDQFNIEADEDGTANVNIEDRLIKLIGPHSVIGRSVIVKSNEDDLGRGAHEYSLSTGNSGKRIGGGVVGIASS